MEIGSEFNLSLSELSKEDDNIMSYLGGYKMSDLYVDSGRSAIKIVAEHLVPNGEILLPEFICESVIRCFSVNTVQFYRVSDQFVVDVNDLEAKITNQTKAIFLMHYFGALQPMHIIDSIKLLARKYGLIVIEDATHSLFTSAHTIGDFVVASVRKWMQIPNGGVLLSGRNEMGCITCKADNYKAYGMLLKDMFLKEILDCNDEYRKIFTESEKRLEKQEEKYGLSDFSRFIMKCVNINTLIEKRRRNYFYLRELLAVYHIQPAIEIDANTCPFVMPIRVPNRDEFRKYLIDNRIYCAVHWPADGIREDERKGAARNSCELISLPIDQRYEERHMEYIADVISRYGGALTY